MKSAHQKWFLAIVALLCLAPAASAVEGHRDRDRDGGRRHVPEGGSAAVYLLAVGTTCLGAMLIRSRLKKAKQS
jgi:hypothetical protein